MANRIFVSLLLVHSGQAQRTVGPTTTPSTTAAPTAIYSSIPSPNPSSPPAAFPETTTTSSPTVAVREMDTTEAPVTDAPETPGPTVPPQPTPPPTFSASDYCGRPFNQSESEIPCVEMATLQDRDNGVGVFYDEAGCGLEANGSVVGCDLNGVPNCRLCVFYRELYSRAVLGGEPVPFVDCPCCVPELYEYGGDIACDFTYPAALLPGETLAPSPAPRTAGGNETANGTVPAIPMEPCEIGAEGDTAAGAVPCVDIASEVDYVNGVGTFYEESCSGVGCSIAGFTDCRLCIFDRAAYNASGGIDDLVDCPCCVPITYKIFPDSSECIWPITPAPTPAPTTLEEFLANGGGSRRPGGKGSGDLLGGLVSCLVVLGGAAAAHFAAKFGTTA